MLLVLVLAGTGCQLRLGVAVDVNRDGGGTLRVSVTADEQLQQRAQEAEADPLGDLVAAGEQLGGGWRVSDTTADGARTVVLSAEFADPEAFSRLTAELSEALAADEVVLLEPMTLAIEDDLIRVQGAAGAQPTGAVRDYGLTRQQAVGLLERTEAFDYDVTVTLPGEVLSSSATDAEGAQLRWTVGPGEQVAIRAEGTRPGPPILRAILGATGGALVAGLVLWLLARRRRSGQADSRSARMRAFSART